MFYVPYSTKLPRDKCCAVLLEPRMFSHKFKSVLKRVLRLHRHLDPYYLYKSVLALVNDVLMQMQKFFPKYSHGDLTTIVLSLGSLYYTIYP